jgi:cell division transport system permease protein
MTASPERTDGFNIYDLFDNNIAHEIRLQEALEEDLLCPFHYFGITDVEFDTGEIDDDFSDFNLLASDERVEKIGKQLSKHEGVLEVKYVSAEEAWAEFQKSYLADNPELAEGFADDNPLANSDNYEVYLESVENQEEVVAFAESLEGVRKVNKSDVVAKTLENFNVLLTYISGAIILILLIVAVFLISNTVSMGITIRREEIAIMKYIGAKDSFVRAPFVIEGILIGVVGAAIPLIILYFGYEKAVSTIISKFSVLNTILEFLPVTEVYKFLLPIGLALGVGIGFIGSFLTIKKHLKA